jgi:predicted nuclease of predicted toxin-antitoxin system
MRFLADESCDFAVVRALRLAGHDVSAIAEAAPSSADDAVLALAVRQGRILLTEDKDFGQWVYANRRVTKGVILLRYPAAARRAMAPAVVGLVARCGERMVGAITVVQPGRVRIGRHPGR